MSSAPVSFRTHSLADLNPGESGVVERLDVPADDAERLMQLGFLPGATVLFTRRAPFGDPRVYRIDDSEIALRRETASQIELR